jgi:hypothetical protein
MNAYHAAVVAALRHHLGAEVAATFAASRIVPDASELRRVVVDAGFREVTVQADVMNNMLPADEGFVLSHLAATPVASAVTAARAELRVALAGEVCQTLRPFVDGDDWAIPDETNVVTAVA